jgi:hypothetical protein
MGTVPVKSRSHRYYVMFGRLYSSLGSVALFLKSGDRHDPDVQSGCRLFDFRAALVVRSGRVEDLTF